MDKPHMLPQTAKRIEFLRECIENEESLISLFDLLEAAFEIQDSPRTLAFQTEIFTFWVTNANVDLNDYRYQLRDLANHTDNVLQLLQECELLDIKTDYVNKLTE